MDERTRRVCIQETNGQGNPFGPETSQLAQWNSDLATSTDMSTRTQSRRGPLVNIAALRVGIEMLKRSGLYACRGDERVDFVLLQADYPPELVRRELSFINKFIQGAQRHPETARRIIGGQPSNLRRSHVVECISFPMEVIDIFLVYFLQFRAFRDKQGVWRN